MGRTIKPGIMDQAFLMMESTDCPAHVAGLQIFALPADYEGDYFADLMLALSRQTPDRPFNLRLRPRGILPGLPLWQEVNFDFEYHVRRIAVPGPGHMAQLLELVERIHSRVLDRRYPLWETYLIEGLEGGRFAMYSKMHHACLDGMASIALLDRIFSPDPADRQPVAPWSTGRSGRKKKEKPARGLQLLKQPPRIMRNSLRIAAEVAGFAMDTRRRLRQDDDGVVALPFTAPPTLMNVPVTARRSCAVCSVPMEEVRQICAAENVTVNDVVMTLCAGALRDFLLDRNALPEESLLATLPVSLRRDGGSNNGNQLAFVLCRLATDLRDPLRRLHAVHASMVEAKGMMEPLSRTTAMGLTLALDGFFLAANQLNRVADRVPPMANLVITSLPGPAESLYWNGARLLSNFPMSVLMDGAALNMTAVSYDGRLDFGIIACRRAIPDTDKLAAALVRALGDLRGAVSRNQKMAYGAGVPPENPAKVPVGETIGASR